MVPVVVTVIGHQCDRWKMPYKTKLKMNLPADAMAQSNIEECMLYSTTCLCSSLVRSRPVTRIEIIHSRQVKRMSKVQSSKKNLLTGDILPPC